MPGYYCCKKLSNSVGIRLKSGFRVVPVALQCIARWMAARYFVAVGACGLRSRRRLQLKYLYLRCHSHFFERIAIVIATVSSIGGLWRCWGSYPSSLCPRVGWAGWIGGHIFEQRSRKGLYIFTKDSVFTPPYRRTYTRVAWYRNRITRNQDQPEPVACQRCGQAEETLVHLMTECPVLEDARSHHFDEDDPITFLFNELEVALSYLRDAGLTEAGHVWSLIERQKKRTTTTQYFGTGLSFFACLLWSMHDIRATQPFTFYGSLQTMGWRPSVADWGGDMSASCKPRVQLFVYAGNRWLHTALRYH